MSRYHSVCMECGFEDTNDEDTPEDCGHPFFTIVDHEGHDEEYGEPDWEDYDWDDDSVEDSE